MEPRASLALALPLLLAGCGAFGASGDDTGNPSGDLGVGVNDMGAFQCRVDIVATNGVTGAATTVAPARLTASIAIAGSSGAHWSLQRLGDATVYPTTFTDSTGTRVQADVTDPGTWTFTVMFDSGPCRVATGSITLGNPAGATMSYLFRVLPPETSGFPFLEALLPITGGVSLGHDFTLDPGTAVSGTLRLGGAAIAGEVRLIADIGPDAVALAGSDGKFNLAVQALGYYTPLLIPDPSASPRAPHLGARAQGISFVGGAFDIPGGVAVGGSVVDGSAAAISGAHVVLRAGTLPSGGGASDVGGAFTLWTEPATYTATFDAPDWPQASIGGVAVPAGGTSLAIAYTTTRVAVGGTVVADDGATPVAGARVTIMSRPLGNVATVSVGGATAVPAAGRVARVVSTDNSGALPVMQLVPGTYDLIVEPPAPSIDGLTAITQVVSGPATWTLALQKPTPLAITVTGLDGKGVAGVRLTAIETVGLGAAPMGLTDANGKYTFVIDRGAPLELVVEPPGATNLAGARVPLWANAGSATIPLGPGLLVSGVVRSPTSDPQPGVRVEALCYQCGSTTPLATSITDASGTYRIYLPDPGNQIVDGGAVD